MSLQALSISRRVWARWRENPFPGWVHSVFERACTLVTAGGDFAALVLPSIGDGPLNLVVDGEQPHLAVLEPGTLAHLEGKWLRIGRLSIALDQATIWEPCPAWEKLRSRSRAMQARLSRLRTLALAAAPEGSLLALLMRLDWPANRAVGAVLDLPPEESMPSAAASTDVALADTGSTELILTRAREAAAALRAGWKGDRGRMQAGAARLAGLGGGLTPAGDDFLVGGMLWAWLAHPEPSIFCDNLLEAASPRTTMLSAAFLRAAARGECSSPWHRLLAALEGGTGEPLKAAVQNVLAHGHTSGADTLSGFLWMGSRFNPG